MNKDYIKKLLMLLTILSSIFLIYHIFLLKPIESNLKYSAITIILIINYILYIGIKKNKKNVINYFMILFILVSIYGSNYIDKMYKIVDSINKNKIVYSASLITLKDKDIIDVSDVSKYKIGIIDDNMSIDNYIIAKEIIDEEKLANDNEIISYSDPIIMLNDLYSGKIDLMFVSSNYINMFSDTDGFENINSDVKVIIEKDKTVKKEEEKKESLINDGINVKPFSVLLMGIDSEKDNLKENGYANGDGLMLITFNPETLNITMMSIPRDSYVPIACRNNTKNKLTHAGWFGTDCMINTIENVFDVDINYYFKINFKGVVSLVDKLGGVTVEVPKKLCTDDSNRRKTICINEGLQTLNGEQALVLARNRHNLKHDDISRGYNQQLLVRALIDKFNEIKSVNNVLDIFDSISNNLDTNLTTEEIMSFYNIFKDLLESKKYQSSEDFLNIMQLKLDVTDKMIYFDNYKKTLSCYILKDESVKNASLEMKKNLNIINTEMIKDFKFN